MKDINILIVGVGGQGTLLASKILGNLALDNDLDVRLSEVHGMAQRGGSVVTHVRMSEKGVYAPVVDLGGADYILAFELLEAQRWLPYLKEGGKMFVNRQKINPLAVMMGATQYPSGIEEELKKKCDVSFLNANALAEQAGTAMASNTVLLGVLAKELPFHKEQWLDEIEKTVKKDFVAINKDAFLKGYES